MTLEHTWIQQLQQRFPNVDLRHDTFFDPGHREIVTTDMLVEDVHFSQDYFRPADIGWRAMAANLSDIAATGGKPQWAVVSLGVPADTPIEFLKALYQGIEESCEAFRYTLVGGDTVRSDKIVLSVTMIGRLQEKATPGRRHTAAPGHILAVSGPHGLSRAGLEVLQNDIEGFKVLKQAHLRPQPQIKLGQQIAAVVPHYAMMDSSDGLADAALRLAEASGVDIILDAERLTIHPDVEKLAEDLGVSPLEWALYGGEDFQLVVSLPSEAVGVFPELVRIGEVRPANIPGKGQALLKQNQQLQSLHYDKTFQHFAPESKEVLK